MCSSDLFMTKGFLAFAVMALVIGPFLIWNGEWKRLFTLAWVPIIFAVLISLPWAILINEKAPDFWRYFFFVENYDRFFKAAKTTQFHEEPFWFFIPVIIIGMLPWAIQLPTAIIGYWKSQLFRKPLYKYLGCWLIFQFIFFSASSGKLATYILPCMPALAILMASGLYNALEREGKHKIFNITSKITGYVFLI